MAIAEYLSRQTELHPKRFKIINFSINYDFMICLMKSVYKIGGMPESAHLINEHIAPQIRIQRLCLAKKRKSKSIFYLYIRFTINLCGYLLFHLALV